MKSNGTTYWVSPNEGATNESGFTGLPGGSRYSNGEFHFLGTVGVWWSSSENLYSNAWYLSLHFINGNVNRYNSNKEDGLSVRCLSD
jgi:uncharacterized protein (TIGR02145 family)